MLARSAAGPQATSNVQLAKLLAQRGSGSGSWPWSGPASFRLAAARRAQSRAVLGLADAGLAARAALRRPRGRSRGPDVREAIERRSRPGEVQPAPWRAQSLLARLRDLACVDLEARRGRLEAAHARTTSVASKRRRKRVAVAGRARDVEPGGRRVPADRVALAAEHRSGSIATPRSRRRPSPGVSRSPRGRTVGAESAWNSL